MKSETIPSSPKSSLDDFQQLEIDFKSKKEEMTQKLETERQSLIQKLKEYDQVLNTDSFTSSKPVATFKRIEKATGKRVKPILTRFLQDLASNATIDRVKFSAFCISEGCEPDALDPKIENSLQKALKDGELKEKDGEYSKA